MKQRDKAEIIARYTERFHRFGGTVEALGSGTDEHQAIRYRVLSEIGDLGGPMMPRSTPWITQSRSRSFLLNESCPLPSTY